MKLERDKSPAPDQGSPWQEVVDATSLPVWATRKALSEAGLVGGGYPDIAYGGRSVVVARVVDGHTQYGVVTKHLDDQGKYTGFSKNVSPIMQRANGKPDLGAILDNQTIQE